ncbi:MAG: ABC transporter family substrate-binding protein [Schumannella sp.]
MTGTGFGYYDDHYALVEDESFGTTEVVSESPFTVRYTVADGVTWSDGVPVDAADLLLAWAGNSGVLNAPGFDDTDYVDPSTGGYTDDFPRDVVFFDGAIGNGLQLATGTPRIVSDRAVEVTYDDFLPTWRLALQPGVAAHVVALHALGLPAGDPDDPASALDAAMTAKAALVAAVVGRDAAELPAVSRFWNSAYNFAAMPDDPSLLVASGPYRVTALVPNESVTLTANPAYHGDREPAFETMTLRVSPDPLETVQLLASGAVDIVTPQPGGDVLRALAAVSGVEVVTGSEGTFEHLDLQFAESRSGLFDDPLIREAFLKAVPRQQILDELIVPLQEDAELLDSFTLRPGADGYADTIAANGSGDYARVDIPGAIALLDEAGAREPRVCILYDPANPRRVAEFTLIRDSAALAGFRVTDCSNTEWDGLLGIAGQYDAALFAWDTTRLGPTAASAVFHSDSPLANFSRYSSPAVDRLIDQVDASDDPAEVTRLLAEIDERLWSDAYGVPLFAYPTVTAVSDRVTGVTRSPLGRGVFWNAWEWAPAVETAPPG